MNKPWALSGVKIKNKVSILNRTKKLNLENNSCIYYMKTQKLFPYLYTVLLLEAPVLYWLDFF